MNSKVAADIARLEKMSVNQLAKRFEALIGEAVLVGNRAVDDCSAFGATTSFWISV